MGNASSYDNESTIIYYKEDREVASHIQSILKAGAIKQGGSGVAQNEADIIILLGKDFS